LAEAREQAGPRRLLLLLIAPPVRAVVIVLAGRVMIADPTRPRGDVQQVRSIRGGAAAARLGT